MQGRTRTKKRPTSSSSSSDSSEPYRHLRAGPRGLLRRSPHQDGQMLTQELPHPGRASRGADGAAHLSKRPPPGLTSPKRPTPPGPLRGLLVDLLQRGLILSKRSPSRSDPFQRGHPQLISPKRPIPPRTHGLITHQRGPIHPSSPRKPPRTALKPLSSSKSITMGFHTLYLFSPPAPRSPSNTAFFKERKESKREYETP